MCVYESVCPACIWANTTNTAHVFESKCYPWITINDAWQSRSHLPFLGEPHLFHWPLFPLPGSSWTGDLTAVKPIADIYYGKPMALLRKLYVARFRYKRPNQDWRYVHKGQDIISHHRLLKWCPFFYWVNYHSLESSVLYLRRRLS